jgi:hypothetical protein
VSEPFRFSLRASLLLTAAAAAVFALNAHSPQLGMMVAVAAVWGALLIYPDVLHRLADYNRRMLIGAALTGASLFGIATAYQELFMPEAYPAVGLAGWTMVCLCVAVWACFRRVR